VLGSEGIVDVDVQRKQKRRFRPGEQGAGVGAEMQKEIRCKVRLV
jgi:hypothetical protein